MKCGLYPHTFIATCVIAVLYGILHFSMLKFALLEYFKDAKINCPKVYHFSLSEVYHSFFLSLKCRPCGELYVTLLRASHMWPIGF